MGNKSFQVLPMNRVEVSEEDFLAGYSGQVFENSIDIWKENSVPSEIIETINLAAGGFIYLVNTLPQEDLVWWILQFAMQKSFDQWDASSIQSLFLDYAAIHGNLKFVEMIDRIKPGYAVFMQIVEGE